MALGIAELHRPSSFELRTMTTPDLQALKPEDYQRIKELMGITPWGIKSYRTLNEQIKVNEIIFSALTRAAQPSPNCAEVEEAIKHMQGFMDGWAASGATIPLPVFSALNTLIKAARSHLAGKSDGEEKCKCECTNCICNEEFIGIFRYRLKELEPDVPCAAFADDHLHNLIARYLHWKSKAQPPADASELLGALEDAAIELEAMATVYRSGEARVAGEKARAAIAEYKARFSQKPVDASELDEWLPIESAPEGKSILLMDGEDVYKGHFSPEMGCWAAQCGQPVVYNLEPTHWMPLPKAHRAQIGGLR